MQNCYCGFNTFNTFLVKDYFYNGLNEYEYKSCLQCNSVYLIGSEKIMHNYNDDYYSISKSDVVRVNYFKIFRYKSSSIFGKILRLIRPISAYDDVVSRYLVSNNCSVLDFGSGSSFYIRHLHSLRLLNKKSFSYDPFSKDPATFVNLKEVPFNLIDLIIANQVFEHVIDPREQLVELYDLSNAKCDLIFSVPVVGSVLDYFGDLSYTFQAPDHITILSLHAWLRLILDTNWKIVSLVEDYGSQSGYYEESIKLAKKFNSKSKMDVFVDKKVDNIIFHLKK